MGTVEYQPGSLVKARRREWIVLPESTAESLHLRPLGGSEDDKTIIHLPLERVKPVSASFPFPSPKTAAAIASGALLRDAFRLKLRAGAGPFRSFGNLSVEPRGYQLVPLLMALKLEPIRLLIADDVGIGKTIEAGLIARELLDRGEIYSFTVICPPHLCEQWQSELYSKFNLQSEIVRTGTATRLDRGLPAGKTIFNTYPITIVSLDFIKSENRLATFLATCPNFVIIDEAHTCVQGSSSSRHQRYRLLKGLAEKADRHMVFLTATPHSGDEDAFYNLLSLLKPEFRDLGELSGQGREETRKELALHFVQRRRPDIAEWKDSTLFPERKSKEATYSLTGEWGGFFDEILSYARGMVQDTVGKTLLQQRMSWWSALALLRCISSSPSAAVMALTTRLKAAEATTEQERIDILDAQALESVFDGENDIELSLDETVPGGIPESLQYQAQELGRLNSLIELAKALQGPKNDSKLAAAIEQIKELIDNKCNPVIFCRYIATAHYLQHHLQEAFKNEKSLVITAVTGELTPEERAEKINSLAEHEKRILVATDCLSEGVNLQSLFNAVLHYDLSWNPTRHEQREGRVDRFNQSAPIVRTVMFYGENNPVDGAVLRVILRKAESIRRDLGVNVPIPEDSNKVMQAVMETVLLHGRRIENAVEQLSLELSGIEHSVDDSWKDAKEKAKKSITLFAQRRLKPEDVLPEWNKAVNILGGPEDVKVFLNRAAERLNARIEEKNNHFIFPVQFLPLQLKERFSSAGINTDKAFKHIYSGTPLPAIEVVHRAHPLISILADYISEKALAEEETELATRSGAIFTKSVTKKTTVYLLRVRHQLCVSSNEGERILLSEECCALGVEGTNDYRVLTDEDAVKLMDSEAGKNMEIAQRERLIQQAVDNLKDMEPLFNGLAKDRSEALLSDHLRVRDSSNIAKSLKSYEVKPCEPVDIIGVYVLMPDVTL